MDTTRRRKKPRPVEQVTDEQLDALAQAAFTFGEFFIEGIIYALRKDAEHMKQLKERDEYITHP